jgi:hypothetical protein
MYDSRAKGIAALQGGRMPKYAQDFRKMLDDRSVDAVVIATPPHWHSLATISYRLGGQKIAIDPKTEQVAGNPQTMGLLRREYRKPWVVPEAV